MAGGTSTSHTVTGLTNNTEYTIRIAATNGTGDGAWSSRCNWNPSATPLPAASIVLSASALTVEEGEGVSYTVSPASLSFTTSNWNRPQTVTVGGEENDVDGEDAAVTVRHEVAGGRYDNVSAASVAVTVTDDDTRGVTVSSASLTVEEGATATYTVALTSELTKPVSVTPLSSNTAAATVLPNSLRFTTSNWNQPQPVTVRGERDDDVVDAVVTIRHAVAGGDYEGLTAPEVTVRVKDSDDEVNERINAVVEEVLPEVNSVVGAHTANAIAERVGRVVDGAVPVGNLQISWGNVPTTPLAAMRLAQRWSDGEGIKVGELLNNSHFNTSGTATRIREGPAAGGEVVETEAVASPWGVWGAVDYGEVGSTGEEGRVEWEAAVITGLLGGDRWLNDQVLAGAALARIGPCATAQRQPLHGLAAGSWQQRLGQRGLWPGSAHC